jgi:hypothetical protein
MNIVLVCIQNFQPYILTNVKQLVHLKEPSIYILTHAAFFHHFKDFPSVKLIDIDKLKDSFHYKEKNTQNSAFRNGFWVNTSLRFFYIYEFMKQYNVNRVIHLENDVLTYYPSNSLIPYVKDKIYIPFDTPTRNIASIMYIPNATIMRTALDHYNFTLNDMQNFCAIRNKTGVIENFPIFIPCPNMNRAQLSVCNPSFPCIFDAAAMGQYLGGIDPMNEKGDTRGFVNKLCVINYTGLVFFDKNKKPFIRIRSRNIPIFNLHIHCKDLRKFALC